MTTIEQAQEISGVGYWELDILKDELLWSNQVYKIFNVNPDNFNSTYENFVNLVHPDDRVAVDEAYTNSLATKKPYEIQHRLLFEDGTIKYVIEKCVTHYNHEGQPTKSIGTVQDVTASEEVRIKLEESKAKFKAISNQTTEGITVADMEGNYVFVNPAFCQMSGYTEEELLKLTVFDMKAKDQDHSSFEKSKEKTAGTPIMVNLQRKDGTEYYTEIIGDIIQVNNEEFVLGTIRDVTERINNEKEIQKLNEELELIVQERTEQLNKTVRALSDEVEQRKKAEDRIAEELIVKKILLKEVTHRVKNNMQIITSLINLQKSHLNDQSSDFLDQISHRIHSMALIHETLYKTNEFEEIQFGKYLDSLIRYVQDSYKSNNILIKSEIEDCTLPLDIASSCGMIIIELVTNSIKYAFQKNVAGTIVVSFAPLSDNKYRLTVSDDGIGFPESIDFKNSQSLGLQLVIDLVKQIMGNIELQTNQGTTFEITFQLNQD